MADDYEIVIPTLVTEYRFIFDSQPLDELKTLPRWSKEFIPQSQMLAAERNFITTRTFHLDRKYLEIPGIGRTQESWVNNHETLLRGDRVADGGGAVRRFFLPMRARIFHRPQDLLLDEMTSEDKVDRFARVDRDLILWKGKALRVNNIGSSRRSHEFDFPEARPFIDNRNNIYFDLIAHYEDKVIQ